MSSRVDNITTSELKSSYDLLFPTAVRFKEKLIEEIGEALDQVDVTLATPMEGRVKNWQSTVQKIETLNLTLKSATEMEDLIGIRLILLFTRDIDRVCDTLSKTVDVLNIEDTGARLGQSEFGYQSIHMQIQAPETWLAVPSFSAFRGLTAEIQVRTVSQHLWAAASHLLQYKQEEAIPLPVRRSIHRVSALLETVDLEFERVLEEREGYARQIDQIEPSEALNVDLLAHFLDENLPASNHADLEDYGALLIYLNNHNVSTVRDLRELFNATKDAALALEGRIVEAFRSANWIDNSASVAFDGKAYVATNKRSIDRGTFLTHVGLVRNMLGL